MDATLNAPEATPRARLIAALEESIIEKGYRDTTVADVVRIARTSRRTFYEHFPDRGACFIALFEQTMQTRIAEIAAAVDLEGDLETQIEHAIDVFIEGESMTPALQQAFVRELPGLPEAAETVRDTLNQYATMLVGLVDAARVRHPEIVRPLSRDVALIVVGGLRELSILALQDGRDMHELRDSSVTVVKAILAVLKAQ